jgi:hypothetical protein
MRLRVTILAASCALALLAPATAAADHGPVVNDPTFMQYMRIAAEYWGQTPSCEGPDGTTIPPHAVMADDPNPQVAAWAEVPGCRIWLDASHWPAPPGEQHCNLIAHEWGHLLGHQHSEDSHNLMWGQWTNNVVPACQAYRPRPAAPPAAPAVASPRKRRAHRKLRHKTRRGRQRCVKVRHVKVRRHGKTVKRRAHKRHARTRCVRRRAGRRKNSASRRAA